MRYHSEYFSPQIHGIQGSQEADDVAEGVVQGGGEGGGGLHRRVGGAELLRGEQVPCVRV